MNSENNKNKCTCDTDAEYPTTSGQCVDKSLTAANPNALNLGYSHSEFSLCAPLVGPIISQQRLPEPTDGSDSDDDLPDEVVLSHTRLSFRAEQQQQQQPPRLYVDMDLYGVGSSAAKGPNVSLRGGEDEPKPSAEQRQLSRAADREQRSRQQRTAFACPLSDCAALLHSSICLSHCLLEHPLLATLQLRPNVTATLRLHLPQVLVACNTQTCIGLLLFASAHQRGNNTQLPPNNANWSGHLAVMGLLWKRSWDAQPNGPMVTHLYDLWLFCPQAQQPLQVLVSAESQIRNESGAARQEVKQQLVPTSRDAQLLSAREMQRENELYMRFTHRDMKLLTNNFTTPIDLRLTIHEEQHGYVLAEDQSIPETSPPNLQSLARQQLRQQEDQTDSPQIQRRFVEGPFPPPEDFPFVPPAAAAAVAATASSQSIQNPLERQGSASVSGWDSGSGSGSRRGSLGHIDSLSEQLLAMKNQNQTLRNFYYNFENQFEDATEQQWAEFDKSLPDNEKVQSPPPQLQSTPPIEQLESAPAFKQLQSPCSDFEEARSLSSEEEVFQEARSRPSETMLIVKPQSAEAPLNASQTEQQKHSFVEQQAQVKDQQAQVKDQQAQGEDQQAQVKDQHPQVVVVSEEEDTPEELEYNEDFLLLDELEDEVELELEEEESQQENEAQADL